MRMTYLLVAAFLFLGVPGDALAQILDRDQVAPTCWMWGGTARSNFPAFVTTRKNEGARIIDVDPRNGNDVNYIYICANTVGPYARPWDADTNVTLAAAEGIARGNGMMITDLAPYTDPQGTVFVSLREAVPAGISWFVVPYHSIPGIQGWFSANPDAVPYSVVSHLSSTGVREYFVLAMSSMPGGPVIRPRSLLFNQTRASLPNPSVPGGSWVSDLNQIGVDLYAAIVSHPLPGETTHYRDLRILSGPGVSPAPWHAQFERNFCRTSWLDASGTTHSTVLQVNNAWSLYSAGYWPNGSSGSPNSWGTTTLGVSSSAGGSAAPGSTLTFNLTPVPTGASSWLALGFQRQILDLTPAGHPGVFVYPTLDLLLPMTGTIPNAQASVTLPPSASLNGLRFYAQAAVFEPGNGVATSNYYLITIQ